MNTSSTAVCLFLSVLLLAFSTPVQGEFVKTVYTSILSPKSVVPTLSDSGGEGIAICILDRNAVPMVVDCEVQFNLDRVFDPFYAGIYRGSPSENGPKIFTFDAKLDSNFRQVFTLESTLIELEEYSELDMENDFLNGKWYIAITCVDFPFGAIRGSLLHEHFIYSRLDNNDVVPRIGESDLTNAHGLTVATYSYYEPYKSASFVIMHDVEQATYIQVREGQHGDIGPSNFVFDGAGSPAFDDFSYTSNFEEKLFEDEQYIQVTSINRPNGEIRGQLETIDQFPTASFTSRLDGLSVKPDRVSTIARGCGLFALDCNSLRLEYLVFHTVNHPTGAWMNLGDRYSDGIKLWPLARTRGPIYGSRLLTAEEVISFYQQRLYVTIESIVYPEGEIRGQISDTYSHYAYLTGTELLPPVTSSGVGCATLRLDETTNKGRVLNYDVHFKLPEEEEVAVELLHADNGLEGETLHSMGTTFASVSGTDVFLSNSEVNALGAGSTYIQVGEPSNPGGAGRLRGQVYHTINTCPFLTSIPNNPVKTTTSSWDRYEVPTYIEWNGPASTLDIMAGIFLFSTLLIFLF